MLRPDEWVAIMGAVAVLIGAITGGLVSLVRANAESSKTRAEVEAMRRDLAAGRDAAAQTATLVAESHHELRPNNGSSIKDATVRLEAAVAELRSDMRGIRRDVGRLADTDAHLVARKEQEHDAINARLDDLNARLDQIT